MEITNKKYYLAANSCKGFVSYFDSAYSHIEGWQCYIIKGGPGTGKSSFMKKLAKKGEEKGYKAELCPCSSDPDSLDAVVFPEIKKIILDGTAPHTLDPKYPAVVETILNFGDFWDGNLLRQQRKEIIAATDKNKSFHKTAASYLTTAGVIFQYIYNTVLQTVKIDKIKLYGDLLCKRYIKGNGKSGKVSYRFLTGITPKGIVSFPETLESYNNLIIIKDDYGCVTDILMKQILNFALSKNFYVIEYKNTFLPDKTDHIVIPELNLAFLRESKNLIFNRDVRRIHAKRFIDGERLKEKRLKYNVKTANSLLESAISTLKQAKATHDDLEKYYIDAMDFDKLFKFFDKFQADFFG